MDSQSHESVLMWPLFLCTWVFFRGWNQSKMYRPIWYVYTEQCSLYGIAQRSVYVWAHPTKEHCNVACNWLSQYAWWRNQMETFSALLAICAGNSPVPGEFPAQRPVTQKFDVLFDLRLVIWRHRNDICTDNRWSIKQSSVSRRPFWYKLRLF